MVRARTRTGVSQVRLFSIGALPSVAEVEPNDFLLTWERGERRGRERREVALERGLEVDRGERPPLVPADPAAQVERVDLTVGRNIPLGGKTRHQLAVAVDDRVDVVGAEVAPRFLGHLRRHDWGAVAVEFVIGKQGQVEAVAIGNGTAGRETEAFVRALGLPRTVERTHVGFMGCHGALNGLRVARAFAEVGIVEITDEHFVVGLVAAAHDRVGVGVEGVLR